MGSGRSLEALSMASGRSLEAHPAADATRGRAQLATRGTAVDEGRDVGARRAKEGGHARVAARSARILDLD